MEDKTNTPEEILDLVDENDVIIGQVKKSEAHKNPKLLHREIAVLIYNDQGKVLFQQRSSRKSVFPGYWTVSCVGHVPSKMRVEEAALKELKEELGLSASIRFVEKVTHESLSEASFIYRYLGKYQGEEIITNTLEVDSAKFLSRYELEKVLESGHQITSLSENYVYRFWAGEFDHLIC